MSAIPIPTNRYMAAGSASPQFTDRIVFEVLDIYNQIPIKLEELGAIHFDVEVPRIQEVSAWQLLRQVLFNNTVLFVGLKIMDQMFYNLSTLLIQ